MGNRVQLGAVGSRAEVTVMCSLSLAHPVQFAFRGQEHGGITTKNHLLDLVAGEVRQLHRHLEVVALRHVRGIRHTGHLGVRHPHLTVLVETHTVVLSVDGLDDHPCAGSPNVLDGHAEVVLPHLHLDACLELGAVALQVVVELAPAQHGVRGRHVVQGDRLGVGERPLLLRDVGRIREGGDDLGALHHVAGLHQELTVLVPADHQGHLLRRGVGTQSEGVSGDGGAPGHLGHDGGKPVVVHLHAVGGRARHQGEAVHGVQGYGGGARFGARRFVVTRVQHVDGTSACVTLEYKSKYVGAWIESVRRPRFVRACNEFGLGVIRKKLDFDIHLRHRHCGSKHGIQFGSKAFFRHGGTTGTHLDRHARNVRDRLIFATQSNVIVYRFHMFVVVSQNRVFEIH